MSLISLIVFVLLQIAFIPLTLVGVVVASYRMFLVSKRLGVSMTAAKVLEGRFFMHIFGIRTDEASLKLGAKLPNISLTSEWLILFPLWLKYKISHTHFLFPLVPEPGSERTVDLITARTLYFDKVIERVAPEVEQFVLMGAGYDTRAYGSLRQKGLTYFELDQANTQQLKRKALHAAGIPSDHVHFVNIDFSKENPFDKLVAAGFDRSKKTLFLWEGVTIYLSESEVSRTLQEVSQQAAPGSTLLTDIYADHFVQFAIKYSRHVLAYTNEPMNFSLPLATDHESVLAEFIERSSLTVGETFFLGTTHEQGPYAVVVEMKCASTETT